MTTIAVGGALASKEGNGGEAWVRLSYALGLRRLGFDVELVEEAPHASETAVEYARAVAASFDLRYTLGPDYEAAADLLVNISGNIRSLDLLRRFRRTAFVDIDPGFTQLWHEQGIEEIARHDVYFTLAENIGGRDCLVPTCGIAWRPTRQPVVLEEWPRVNGGFDRFSTVARWRSPFGPIAPYGLKHHEWRKFWELPMLTGLSFEAVLDIDPADAPDRDALVERGWQLADPRVTADPGAFRSYVQSSSAEFSVAQGLYVETRSGWFSGRSVRYLASGRPVLLQDTCFGNSLPVGEGLLAFRTLDEAAAGVRAIVDGYEEHARSARAIAAEHFDSDRVLSALLEDTL